MSLLIDKSERKKSVYSAPLIVGFCIVIVLGSLSFVYFRYIEDSASRVSSTEELEAQRAAALKELYSTEGVPVTASDSGLDDYGLSTAEPEGILGGFVFFTGLKNDEEKRNRVYYYDLSEVEPVAKLYIPPSVWDAYIDFSDVSTPTDFMVKTTFARVDGLPVEQDDNLFQLYEQGATSLKQFESIAGNYEGQGAWLPETDLFAYARLSRAPAVYSDLLPLDNWETVISDMTTDSVVKVISGAVHPKWSPDGKYLMVQKKDGLHIYDLESDEITQVVTVTSGDTLATTMYDVSRDGKYLLQTVGKSGVIVMSEVISWSPFEYVELGRFDTTGVEYYWPQFSPKGDFYVVQAIDVAKEGPDVRENPRLEFRGTLYRDVLRTIPVNEYDFNSLFIDTWTQTLPIISAQSS